MLGINGDQAGSPSKHSIVNSLSDGEYSNLCRVAKTNSNISQELSSIHLNHRELSMGSIKSLVLMRMLSEYKIIEFQNLLWVEDSEATDSEFLGITDADDNSVLSVALDKGLGLRDLMTFLSLNQEKGGLKLNDNDAQKIAAALTASKSDYHPQKLFSEIVCQVYDSGSSDLVLSKIGESTHLPSGQDWLDSWYT